MAVMKTLTLDNETPQVEHEDIVRLLVQCHKDEIPIQDCIVMLVDDATWKIVFVSGRGEIFLHAKLLGSRITQVL